MRAPAGPSRPIALGLTIAWALLAGVAGVAVWNMLATPAFAQLEPRPSNSPTPFRPPTVLATLVPGPTLQIAPVASPTRAVAPTPSPTSTLAPPPVPATGQLPGAAPPADLSALVLTQADVPAGLELEPRLSGTLSFLGVEAYLATFVAPEARADLARVPALPSRSIMTVTSAVQLFASEEPSDQQMDGIVRGAQAGMRLFAGASPDAAVDMQPPIDLPDPPVGAESRAFAVHGLAAGEAFTATAILFRRDATYGYVIVQAVGDEPLLAETLRLAQLADARLMAAGYP